MLLFLACLGSANTTLCPPRRLAPPCIMVIYDGDKIWQPPVTACTPWRLEYALAGEAGEALGLQGAEGFKVLTARGAGCVVLACILLVALRLLYLLRRRHAEQPAQRGLLVLAPPPSSPQPPVKPLPPMPLRPPSLPPTPPSLPPQLDRPEDEEALLAQELHAQELAGLAAEAAEAAEAESPSQHLSEATKEVVSTKAAPIKPPQSCIEKDYRAEAKVYSDMKRALERKHRGSTKEAVPTKGTPIKPPQSHSEEDYSADLRHIAWIEYYVRMDKLENAYELGWDGKPFQPEDAETIRQEMRRACAP